MALPIEDYALISNCHSAALVGKNGSIDWLCFPCFDSAACFASLLGSHENGHWQIAPQQEFKTIRKYIDDTMVLETTFETVTGSCKIIDCMLMNSENPTLIRTIEGIEGVVQLDLELTIRFDYGNIVPWVRRNQNTFGINAIAGPDAIVVYSPIELHGKNLHTAAEFQIESGERKSFTLMWYSSHLPTPCELEDPYQNLKETISWWENWSSRGTYQGFDTPAVKRSLLTLKALNYQPTGAIVAAPTTSLPENIGGVRNWDYRYGWIRDSSFTLLALLSAGHKEEAIRWNDWLLRAVAGTPSQMNIMYGIRAERRLTELELDWLSGYENSKPVRIGNDAYTQFQLDVYGEFLASAYLAQENGITLSDNTWRISRKMIEFVCNNWQEPDEGIWEIRGPRKHFTHSKVMAWVALHYAIESAIQFNLECNLEKWIKVRDEIHQDICEKGFDKELNSFVQYYGSKELDASLLLMSHFGFLPHTDPRIIGTVEAIQKHLMQNGLLLRYKTQSHVDGLPGNEGCFIACSFWLVHNLNLIGRHDEAMELYQYLQSLRNDVGLFAEEYSPVLKRMLGNFPQGLSHIAHINAAMGYQLPKT